MIIKRLEAKAINDTRGDKTIEVELYCEYGKFKASAPNGKSKGKYEVSPWKKSINEDIEEINNTSKFSIDFNKFEDLKKVENKFKRKIGGNSLIAIEYCFLKALAFKERKEVWQIILKDKREIKVPRMVANIIGGGAHSKSELKPEFQEFHVIPKADAK
ncbi:MAG: hypothetical protein QXJ28_02165, partial [Candidatus Pacearchaeota archaeon]